MEMFKDGEEVMVIDARMDLIAMLMMTMAHSEGHKRRILRTMMMSTMMMAAMVVAAMKMLVTMMDATKLMMEATKVIMENVTP